MNDRITKIIIETLGKEGVIDSRAFGHWALSDDQLEKFAELIVKECVGIALEQKKWVEDMVVLLPQHVEFNRLRIQQSQRIVDKIKEHFGVEE